MRNILTLAVKDLRILLRNPAGAFFTFGWPLILAVFFLMPTWMLAASHASPVKWAVLALEGALWRGFALGEMLLPCGILLAMGALAFAVGARAFRSA